MVLLCLRVWSRKCAPFLAGQDVQTYYVDGAVLGGWSKSRVVRRVQRSEIRGYRPQSDTDP